MRPTGHRPVRRLIVAGMGAMLVVVGIMLAVIDARNLQDYRAAMASRAASLINLGSDAQPQAGQDGARVRVVATPSVGEAPRDGQFNLQVNTPLLTRHVAMFQWREIHIGPNVHYELDWVDHLLDAAHFQHPAGHANPPQWPIKTETFAAGKVQMGGFALSPALARALPGSAPVTPEAKSLPPNMAASFSRYQNYLVTSRDPGKPQLGDLRVSWSRVPLQVVTTVARVSGGHLEAAPHTGTGKGYDMVAGNVSLLDMFPDVPLPPRFLWLGRIAAVLLAALGALMLLWYRAQQRDPWLALGLGSAAVGLVTGALWLQSDRMLMAGWWALALIGAGLVAFRVRRRS